MYIPLTTHSSFSLQEGLASPAELVQAAHASAMPALGLTDHHLLTGTVEFVQACKEKNIQPVVGLDIDLQEDSISLLATSGEGWSNLCRLSSTLALREDPDAPCSLDLLDSFAKDLIALTTKPELIKDIFAGRLYVKIQDQANAAGLARAAGKYSLPTVITHPVYYLMPDQTTLQRTLTAIRLNEAVATLPREAAAPADAYFLNAAEVEARFKEFPDALAATVEIAERCRFDFPLGISHMPAVPTPDGMSMREHLHEKAHQGAMKLYGEITPTVQARLEHELDIISRMGFEPVFLIVEDILRFTREAGIPYSSRGSAASSLVAHCLEITSPDPLRLNLYFERFLNPARTTPPDIDTDLCSRRRDQVLQHVFHTYGAERVAMVGTINRYRPKSALGDVAKAHGLAPSKVRELSNQLPHAFWARFAQKTADGKPVSPFADLRAAYPSPDYQTIFHEAEAILNLPRHLSMHPGGIIVAPGNLTDLVPVMRSGGKSVVITQLDLDAVEALGLVKIDLLGIRGLTVLGDVAEFIQASQRDQFTDSLAVLDSTPSDDPATAQRIEKGETIGCFQIESPGMRATLREIRARSEDDIMAALALYRPGPLSGGLKDAFVRRFKGQEPVKHIHPALAPLLDETFGVILYQEQVLRIANSIAGFDLAEADLLRRAMSHFDPGKRMQELKRKFIEQAEQRNGIPADTGERIWEMMAAFAGYGFPKAHAASYAKVAWRSAWCKSYFPAEFMAAVLANWGGYYSQRVYLSEARRMGLKVRPPHVNYSRANFSVSKVAGEGSVLFMGLEQVKELTQRSIQRIIHNAPFISLDDFLMRVDPRALEAENLAKVGALDGFGNIPVILKRLKTGGWQQNQMSLFGWNDTSEDDWSLQEKVDAQMERLGVSLDAHPLELVVEKIQQAGAISTAEAAGRIGRRVTIAGIRQTSHRTRTASGESMLFLTVEDLQGTLDAILFPEVYRLTKNLFNTTIPLLMTGIIEMDTERGEPYLRVEKIVKI
jgi:DNA-directed DNA polymerase III PolC